MNAADALCREYERVLKLKWPSGLSGEERVWMAIYDPSNERKVRARLGQFELATKQAGRAWRLFNLEEVFPQWMASNKYREQLFAKPKAMRTALGAYRQVLTERLRAELDQTDDQTVLAVLGAGSLFGLWSVSELVSKVAGDIQGILLVFFPGRHEGTVYKLLDARISWSYLALPIEAKVGG